jgi:acyl carrier protein
MDRLLTLLSKILDIPKESITDETSPDNVPSWDSFNGLMMVSELESTFDVKFTMDEITAVKNVKDIKEFLKKHGVKLNE